MTEIPANTTATIYIPTKNVAEIIEGDQPLAANKAIQIAGTETDYAVLKVGSGKYQFTIA